MESDTVVSAFGQTIAYCGNRFRTDEDNAANARLIAAAPDLLDALILALPYVETAQLDAAYKPGSVAKVVKELRAAIRKSRLSSEQRAPDSAQGVAGGKA